MSEVEHKHGRGIARLKLAVQSISWKCVIEEQIKHKSDIWNAI